MANDYDDTDFDFEDFGAPSDNPDLAAAAAAMVSETTAPEMDDPLDGPVTLPGGFRRLKLRDDQTRFEDVRTAWVRELNGEDEEHIAKARARDDVPGFVNAVLERGIERLGEETPTKDDLSSLVLGDRDFLLMEIARATYGNDLDYSDFQCYHCGEVFDITVHLDEDVPVTRLKDVAETEFDVRLTKDRVARVHLPDGTVGAKVAVADNSAVANTLFIAGCVDEIRGPRGTVRIAGDEDAARSLSVRDRQTLVNEMGQRMPGPRYNEVTFVHEDGTCDKEVRLSVTLADLFRGM